MSKPWFCISEAGWDKNLWEMWLFKDNNKQAHHVGADGKSQCLSQMYQAINEGKII